MNRLVHSFIYQSTSNNAHRHRSFNCSSTAFTIQNFGNAKVYLYFGYNLLDICIAHWDSYTYTYYTFKFKLKLFVFYI